jgi:hypothetical protein
MSMATTAPELSKQQLKFIKEHPRSSVTSGYNDSVIVYEYTENLVHRSIIAKNGDILDAATFPATPGDLAQAEKADAAQVCDLEELFQSPSHKK